MIGPSKTWTLVDGAAVAHALATIAKAEGYLLSIYGSVLSGEGRDLDLILTPWRRVRDPKKAMSRLIEHVHGKELGSSHAGVLGTWSTVAELPDGRWLDIMIRETAPTDWRAGDFGGD